MCCTYINRQINLMDISLTNFTSETPLYAMESKCIIYRGKQKIVRNKNACLEKCNMLVPPDRNEERCETRNEK